MKGDDASTAFHYMQLQVQLPRYSTIWTISYLYIRVQVRAPDCLRWTVNAANGLWYLAACVGAASLQSSYSTANAYLQDEA